MRTIVVGGQEPLKRLDPRTHPDARPERADIYLTSGACGHLPGELSKLTDEASLGGTCRDDSRS